MGRRKASIPKALKIAKGDKNAPYEVDDVPDVISIRADQMPMPEDFDEYEVEAWNELVKSLQDRALLSPSFREMMVNYCRVKGQWLECTDCIRDEGLMIAGFGGKMSPHPLLAQQNKLMDQLIRFSQHFGLSPYANACLRVPDDDKIPEDEKKKKRFFA
jgi:P27 family predicted phage terminase small subunit